MKNDRFFINVKGSRIWLLTLLCIVAIFLAYCGLDKLTIVSQPTTAIAGQTITTTLMIHDTSTIVTVNPLKLVIGVLVPKSWHAGQPGNTTITFTSPYPGRANIPQTMSLIPSSVVPQGETTGVYPSDWPSTMQFYGGLGGNLLGDMEWVAFWSDSTYNFASGAAYNPVIVTIQAKVGPQNTLVKLGYFASYTGEAINGTNIGTTYSIANGTDCFSVSGGKNPIEDFCDPQLVTVTPLETLDNDVVTIGVDMNVLSTALDNASRIYLCDTAFTTDGHAIPNCIQNNTSAFKTTGSKKWQFEFWPRKYFNLKPGQSLDHIDFYLTDATGNIKIGFNNTTHPPTSTASPFVIQFQCD